MSAISSLVGMNIDRDNYKLVEAYVETLGLPMRAEICAFIEKKFGQPEDIAEEALLSAIGTILPEKTDKKEGTEHE